MRLGIAGLGEQQQVTQQGLGPYPIKITSLTTYDLRFPTLAKLDGSDAMNPDLGYSAAYVVLGSHEVAEGHGLSFTIRRGNKVVCAVIKALAPRVIGLELDWIREDPGRFWRHVTSDSQLHWIGPDKGAIHLGDGCRCQHGLGPVGQGGGQAGVPTGSRHEPGRAHTHCRLPLQH